MDRDKATVEHQWMVLMKQTITHGIRSTRRHRSNVRSLDFGTTATVDLQSGHRTSVSTLTDVAMLRHGMAGYDRFHDRPFEVAVSSSKLKAVAAL
jgi:hypothetical protein